ncbi:glucose-6-phosphate 1-epimerase [Dorcoceras hygrometricum]|uniref:Glucose-6-phosphate 1-epimerase n=1 Tax=Dorcoceras hygrometricum TaxID=472368 RepID=A0A2Z7BRV5_9LAMI|nr:glucose-6-phosphate 1-epimerase [Dorcoceras hygrometricum]
MKKKDVLISVTGGASVFLLFPVHRIRQVTGKDYRLRVSMDEAVKDYKGLQFLSGFSCRRLALEQHSRTAVEESSQALFFPSQEGNPTITLELKDGLYSHSMWDYSFQALYKITLDKNSLTTELNVKNTDEKPFSFGTTLHTYFNAFVSGASVRGLKGCKTLNKDPDPKNPVEGKEERDTVTFPGFVDCIYLDAPEELHLDNGLGDSITIKNTNWSDTVLWNPHLTMESCYKDFVCVENAKIGQVQLQPNETWTAVQHLSLV